MNKQSLYEQYEMEELLPIVAELTKKFTSNESSSITYERANQLMEAVIYCIRELDMESASNVLQGTMLPAREAYEKGYQLVLHKTMRVKEMFNAMIVAFDAYGNRTYYETVAKGIPGFFLYYDAKFMPQNHILTLDYPVLTPCDRRCGIDVMELYIEGICCEQVFLNRLPREYVIEVLEAYHTEYKELLINISVIVMRNILGCMLADKPVFKKGFSKEDYAAVKQEVTGLNKEKLEEKLAYLLSIFLEKGYQKEAKRLYSYFRKDSRDFAFELKNAAEHDSLSALFVL